MTLHGIDIASWQAGIVPSATDADFVIVKATGGVTYENPYWRQWADDVLASGKLLGLYHYANDYGWHRASDEARWFLDHVAPYKGRFIPMLDVEAEALGNSVDWSKTWLDAVAAETGATPWFYTGASAANARDWSAISRYPLWMACYYDRYAHGGFVDQPYCGWSTGSWPRMACHQYTSEGRIAGYGGNLDLNAFFGTREDWISMQGGATVDRADVAAYFHRRMADDDRFGYSQGPNRWGGSTVEEWEHGGVVGRFAIGDRDCSSSVIDCWREALRGSEWEHALDGATYTGNMRSVFVGSGLFRWHPRGDGYIAQRGDVYLNESSHTAMCQSAVPDMLTEALINEHGQIVGGEIGDQTGREFVYRAFWEYPWDGTLEYNHLADTEEDMTPQQAEQLEFIYNHLHWRESDHFSDMGNLVAEFPVEYETIDEEGEKSPLTQPLGKRIGYIDQRIHVIEANQAAMGEKLDKLLEALVNKAPAE